MELLKQKVFNYVDLNSQKTEDWLNNTAQKIADELNVSRNVVSQYLNEFVKVGEIGKVNSRPVLFFSLPKKNLSSVNFNSISEAKEWLQSSFEVGLDNVVGRKGSLKEIIPQIKAAIEYPPYGLPILLQGATGTGKSYLANMIYEDLLVNNIIEDTAAFIAVNCSEYSNNPELFLSNFFGHIKGAYTGANTNRKGLVELANGGVLFLDEVHSLSSECQEKLFQYMDTATFRRMGDNEHTYKSECRIIFATSEKLNESLLPTLVRRIPVKLVLPSLENRSIFERKQLIKLFFELEEKRLDKNIVISQQLLKYLLNYHFSGNVGNLKNIIQLACANAFISFKKNTKLTIQMTHLPKSLEFKEFDFEESGKSNEFIALTSLNNENEQISVSKLLTYFYREWEKIGVSEKLFERYNQFIKQNIHPATSQRRQEYPSYLESRFRKYVKEIERDFHLTFNYYYLQVNLLFFDIWLYQSEITPVVEAELASFLDEICSQCQQEYQLVERFIRISDISITKKQRVIMIILFKLMLNKEFQQKRLALIIAHGRSTATSIANTANRMLNEYIFDSIDMPFQTTSEETAEKINDYLETRLNFEEIILLVDMGALEKIHKNLSFGNDKKIGLLNNVSTAMALDVGNQLNLKLPLKDILKKTKENQIVDYVYQYSEIEKDMIICSCASGLGTSFKLKQILEDSFPNKTNIIVETCDYYSLAKENYLEELRKDHNILFIVGTLNPDIEGIDFYSIEDLILGVKIKDLSSQLTKYFTSDEINVLNENILKRFSLTNLMEQLTILNPSKLLEQVSDAIYILQNELGLSLANNICFGLYVHVSCLIERLVKQNHLQDEISVENKSQEFAHFYNQFKKSFTVVEQFYSVEIPMYEILYVYDYIKKA